MHVPQVKYHAVEFRLVGGLAGVGKTVPSYRMALEWEISGWKKFGAALASRRLMS